MNFHQDLKEMSVLANSTEVLIPVDAAFKQFREAMRPGFTGRVRIPLTIRQEAALAVEFGPAEISESQRVGTPQPCLSPEGIFDRRDGRLTERELVVDQKLNENKFKIKVGVYVRAIVGDFKDGMMNGFTLERGPDFGAR